MAADHGLTLLDDLERLLREAGPALRPQVACEVRLAGRTLPVWVVEAGSQDPAAPVLGLFGGVHGLERIGTELVLAFLAGLVRRSRWDSSAHHLLAGVRVVAMPLVNPGGLLRGTRANPAGVDLMRNAPVECRHGAPALVGGQRLGPGLPWFRGAAGQPMQPEAQALCDTVRTRLMGPAFALSLDCHSGFGMRDRLWFPHAHTPEPVAHLPELQALRGLMDQALAHHRYVMEPQSRQYLAHGDLWDHLYLQAEAQAPGVLLPLTLEMGSWLWVKKNPRQAFSRHGLFNPLIEHRQQRVLRRHLSLLDFLLRAVCSHRAWLPGPAQREPLRRAALADWYGGQAT
jgi:hypothetical protein